ncbi:MAG TPA: DUF1634 domain-containing protein [Phycisphaerae bacterium]|jgi:uncharacterized membrane protein|nr:DUF1634 domain-containing protein [Phycisphaerae bacterium]HOB74232.1 DUF1634 domain-containing protein [Phycisphaerae bacterium]HOJ55020.1 DUF1634 domain-containing protein [Phycisphaerae bacterium]HOL26959.1 DUF1634 domain-containing protein [Phycisphaerae bacterium]HPP21388.1 DUF1634 domain-containing protein [Phycisphaerae bacterium]
MSDAPQPPPAQDAANDKFRQMELWISTVLRIGVGVSLFLVLGGTILSFIHHPDYVTSRTELSQLVGPEADFPHSLPAVAKGMWNLQGRAFVAAGLLALIATPVMRVLVSIISFVYQRDRAYVAITTIVLALLLFSFLVGKTQ